MSIDASPPAQPPQMSPDGNWVWDGSQWQPVTGVEPTHEGVFAVYANRVEAAEQAVAAAPPAAVATPVQVAAPVQVATPAVDYPYPAPAAEYYPPAEPVIPLWEQQPSSGKTVYLYVGGAVVLFAMVLIVLNTLNFLSLPFLGGQTSSSPPQAAKPSPAPTTRSEYTRADVFLNGSFAPALVTLGEIDPPMATCSGDFTNSCFNAITVSDPPLKHVLSVINQASIPACIAVPMKTVGGDLVYMEGGLQTALKAYKDGNQSELVDGLYHFTHGNAVLSSDVQAANAASKARCSTDKEGP